MHEIAGLDRDVRITAGFDLLASIITKECINRFLSYKKAHPPKINTQKQNVNAAFLDKHGITEEVVDLARHDLRGCRVSVRTYEPHVHPIAQTPDVTLCHKAGPAWASICPGLKWAAQSAARQT